MLPLELGQESGIPVRSAAWDMSDYLLPPKVDVSGKLEAEIELGLESRHPAVGCRHPRWGPNQLTKRLTLGFFRTPLFCLPGSHCPICYPLCPRAGCPVCHVITHVCIILEDRNLLLKPSPTDTTPKDNPIQ